MDPLFPQLPGQITDLTDDQLREYLEGVRSVAQTLKGDDADAIKQLVGERTDVEVEKELTEAVAAYNEAKSALDAREAEAAEVAANIDTGLGEILNDATPEGEGETNPGEQPATTPDQPAEPAAQPAPEPAEQPATTPDQPAEPAEPAAEPAQLAASARSRGRRFATPARARDREPVDEAVDGPVIVAAGGTPSFREGDRLTADQIGEALLERAQQMSMGGGHDGEQVIVAQVRNRLHGNEQMTLSAAASPTENMAKIDRVRTEMERSSMQSLVAAGGLCAPVTPYYELADFGTDRRPVRDSLAVFNADRGGIQFAAPPKLTDVSTGTWIRTEAQDAAGTPAKTCQTVPCPAFSTVKVSAVGSCITIGNFSARTFPEQLNQFRSLVGQSQARIAEINLLDRIKASGTTFTTALTRQLGTAEVPAFLGQAAAAMRNRHRMEPDQVLEALLPAWVNDAWEVDDDRANRFQESSLTEELRELNIEPVFYLDGETGGSQIFGAQAAGANPLVPWLTSAIAYLFAPGSFLFLDAGTLNIGIVRDSTLNAANNLQIFQESFEEIAFIGVESLRIPIPICPSGARSASVTVTCPV